MGFDNVKIDSCSEFHDLSLWESLLNATGRAYIIEDCFQGGVVVRRNRLLLACSSVALSDYEQPHPSSCPLSCLVPRLAVAVSR